MTVGIASILGCAERRCRQIVNGDVDGGFITMQAIAAFYCGYKFAPEAIWEPLGREVADFNIRVTA